MKMSHLEGIDGVPRHVLVALALPQHENYMEILPRFKKKYKEKPKSWDAHQCRGDSDAYIIIPFFPFCSFDEMNY